MTKIEFGSPAALDVLTADRSLGYHLDGEARLQKIQNLLSDLGEERADLEGQIDDLEDEKYGIDQEIEALERALKELQPQIQTLKSELAELEARLS